MTQSDYSLTGMVLAVGTITLLTVLSSWLVFRFRSVRSVLEPVPLIVIQDGKPVEHNLRHERLTLEEVAGTSRHASSDTIARPSCWAVVESKSDDQLYYQVTRYP